MSESRAQNIKVGIFVIGLSLTVLVSVFILGGSSEMLERRYQLEAKWEDVAGLKEGAVVRLAGWDVGAVNRIAFADELEQRELTVTMKIMSRYQDRIRTDSIARIDTVGVLGDKYVSISMGTPSAEGLKDGDIIEIDAEARTINAPDVNDAEWEKRRAGWKAPPLEATSGTLYKYTKLVASASQGCITDL